MPKHKILVACEFSGVVRNAFRNKGFEAWSCDLIESEDNSPFHIIEDAIELIKKEQYNLIIAHPPCTYLCNSGVRWLYKDGKGSIKDLDRWKRMKDGAEFFKSFFNIYNGPLAIENPIMHSYATNIVKDKPSQIIQPWQFGHKESKATCLWLRNLPNLIPTKIEEEKVHKSHYSPDSKNRWKRRSRTYTGIAEAMADQWGKYLENSCKLT